uniref:Uncharacterized protein n=1 Tax=Anguilla anguilla TaxID=7936 RepID=A0A0E9TRZ5_ANGAN
MEIAIHLVLALVATHNIIFLSRKIG